MKTLLLFSLFSSLVAFDFAEEARKYVDQNVDPCDDFYRHACRLEGSSYLPYQIVSEQLKGSHTNRNSTEFPEIEDVVINGFPKLTDSLAGCITDVFKNICESGKDTLPFLANLEPLISKILIEGNTDGSCFGPTCLTHLAKDPNCDRVAEHLSKLVEINIRFSSLLNNFKVALDYMQEMDMFLEKHSERSVENMHSFFMEIKDSAIELIMVTPWTKNHNVSESVADIVHHVSITNALNISRSIVAKTLTDTNNRYTECKNNFANVTSSYISEYCFFQVCINTDFEPLATVLEHTEDDIVGASTLYPHIRLGEMWYQIFINSHTRAARLGSPGFTIAHELSHSLIKSSEIDILSYFSQEAKECIQNQYKSSCKEFDEGECVISEKQFEENGADAFAMEIIWRVFERQYIDREKRIREIRGSEKLKQLFYSMASVLCDGEKAVSNRKDPHAPNNIRINALVNHPAFEIAFQCSTHSRMMVSKTKQCSVYGDHAPQHRRRVSPIRM